MHFLHSLSPAKSFQFQDLNILKDSSHDLKGRTIHPYFFPNIFLAMHVIYSLESIFITLVFPQMKASYSGPTEGTYKHSQGVWLERFCQ